MNSRAKVVGITGTIGAGKSIVRKLFEHLFNVYTYDCDSQAKKLYFKPEFRSEVTKIIGEDPINDTGKLKKELLQKALSNPDQREKIESVIHSALLTDIETWIEQHKENPMVLIETAILFSSGFIRLCDKVIIVQADKNIREKRVERRDKEKGLINRFDVLTLLQEQETKLQSRCQNKYIIDNNGNISLIKQVENTYNNIVNNQ